MFVVDENEELYSSFKENIDIKGSDSLVVPGEAPLKKSMITDYCPESPKLNMFEPCFEKPINLVPLKLQKAHSFA